MPPPPPSTPDLMQQAAARASALLEQERNQQELRQIESARADINNFIEYCFQYAPNKYIRQGAIHRKWQAHVDRNQSAGVIAPRNHGKSQQLVIYRTIWELGKNPNLRIKIVCNDLPKAQKRLRAIKMEIERNTRIQAVFPNLVPDSDSKDWRTESFTVRRDIVMVEPSVEARPVLGAATGGRADLLIFDDICDHKNAIKNPKERVMVISAVDEDWMNLLEPDGRSIYCATPWHRMDYTHKAMASEDWKFLKIVINDRIDPIWPEKWDREALLKKRKQIGAVPFARGFHCKTIVDEQDTLFSEASLQAAKDFDTSPKQAIEMSKLWPKYTGVDIAAGKRTRQSKYQVALTIAVNPATGQRVPIDIHRKREPMPRFMQRLKNVAERFSSTLVIENNATQEAIIALGRDNHLRGLPVKSVHTGREKMDIAIGVPALAAEFDSGMWLLPYGKDTAAGPVRGTDHAEFCECNLCLLINECKDGILSQTTDLMMGAWLATRLIRRRVAISQQLSATPRQLGGSEWDPATADIGRAIGGGSASHDPGW